MTDSESDSLSYVDFEVTDYTDVDKLDLIATHDGKFHADEVFACYLLKLLFPTLQIVRTRDPEKIKRCKFVVDVGRVYDPNNNRFDHHQSDFNETLQSLTDLHAILNLENMNNPEDCNGRLSSAGLVYAHYGREAIGKILGIDVDHELMTPVFSKLYADFVSPIDLNDNGKGLGRKFTVTGWFIAARAKFWNPKYTLNTREACEEGFQQATKFVEENFESDCRYVFSQAVFEESHAKLFRQAYSDRFKLDPKGRLLFFDSPISWGRRLGNLGVHDHNSIHYVVVREVEHDKTLFKVRAVDPIWVSWNGGPPRIDKRKHCENYFPVEWRGLHYNELSQKLRINGCLFVHREGHIAGNSSYNGAMKMALKALDEEIEEEEVVKEQALAVPMVPETEFLLQWFDESFENGEMVTAAVIGSQLLSTSVVLNEFRQRCFLIARRFQLYQKAKSSAIEVDELKRYNAQINQWLEESQQNTSYRLFLRFYIAHTGFVLNPSKKLTYKKIKETQEMLFDRIYNLRNTDNLEMWLIFWTDRALVHLISSTESNCIALLLYSRRLRDKCDKFRLQP